jgi:L-seryl-tRNA(Ser) seleniumtransferase
VGGGNDAAAARLRELPAVHELVAKLAGPHALAVSAARQAIEEARTALLADDGGADADAIERRARGLLESLGRPTLTRVLNATGVILHTNLGRAPLAPTAQRALAAAAQGYSNLELDLESGQRGSRQAHVEALLRELTGAEAALVVNNGAGAVLLATAALAGPGGAVIVSRGQLVEIGGGFRIPEVVAQSGARLIEVGTTNRTRSEDYRRALEAAPAAVILRVHQSNFRSLGFVGDVAIEALCGFGAAVVDDVGSGVLADAAGISALSDEPPLRRSVAAGAALVCCSGDKLLGGPQAGLLVGRRAAVKTASEHPLARALRIDKLSLAALEATLMLLREPARARHEIPVLAMLEADEDRLTARAQRLCDAVGTRETEIVRATAKVGGGALPLLELEGPAVALAPELDPSALMLALRRQDPPLIARVHDGRVLLDPRTLSDAEIEPAAHSVRAAVCCLPR